jgi:WD40 repeat protein
VRVAHFDPTSRRVVGASWDGTARVWDASAPYLRWSSPALSDDCGLGNSLQPDRRYVAIGCLDHATQIWDTARDRLVAELPSVTLPGGDFEPAFPAVSADGERAAIARGSHVEIYELPSGKLLQTIAHRAAVSTVAFADAGRDVISGAVDGSIAVSRGSLPPISLPLAVDIGAGIDAAVILADGRIVATDAHRRLRVIDPDRGEILADLETTTRVGLLRVSPDGRHLITIPSYRAEAAPATLWDLQSNRLIAHLVGHVGQVFSARFVNGAIVTAGGDGTARIWDSGTGQLRQTFRISSRFLADATLSGDGALMVAGDADGVLQFWDVATSRAVWRLRAHRSYLVAIHFEGDDIVTRGFGGDIARWRLSSPEQIIEACAPANEVAGSSGEPCDIVKR